MTRALTEFVPDAIWLQHYPVRYAGCRFNASMSVIRLDDDRLMLQWNKPRPAPEYRLGCKDRRAAHRSWQTVLGWPFDRIVLSHGDNIASEAKRAASRAWRGVRGRGDSA